jgi:hypothetical protein
MNFISFSTTLVAPSPFATYGFAFSSILKIFNELFLITSAGQLVHNAVHQ